MANARARLLVHLGSLGKVKKSSNQTSEKTGCATRDRQEGEGLRIAVEILPVFEG